MSVFCYNLIIFVAMNLDYIVVGCGLSGIAFCEQLKAANKQFVVFDNQSQQSSLVAAGMYNPVILKRFSEVWKAQEQLNLALPFYKRIEDKLNVTINYSFPIYRKFASIEEQNMWFEASDKPKLEPFLSPKIVSNHNANINAPFGFGQVLSSGRIDTNVLIASYRAYLKQNNLLIEKPFQYDKLHIQEKLATYDTISAKHIVFCEGFGLKQNPFFNDLPLNGTKGEVITIKAPKLACDVALKSSVFVIPESDDLYTVGATYNWEDKTNLITEDAKQELVLKLKTLITCDFEVVNQVAGIRPTVKDRRPLVGRHPKHKNIYVCNGLGTRGVMIAPYISEKLFNFIENNQALDAEISIDRFFI